MPRIDDFVAPPGGWGARVGVLALAYGGHHVARTALTPWVQQRFFGFVQDLDPGPQLLVGHAIAWQGAHTLVCLLILAVLVRVGALQGIRFPDVGAAMRWGLGIGLGLSAVLISLWWTIGDYQVDIDPWKMTGNLFSNLYEELGYRALLFGAALYAFRRFTPAALLSSLVFGFSHTQYPLPIQGFTVVVGGLFALAYWRTGTLLAPWIAHQASDMILDTFLVA